MRRFWNWLIFLGMRTLICLVQAVSIETCHSWSRLLATAAYDILKIRRQIIAENLQHAFPNLSLAGRHKLARRMWQHIILLICELAQARRKIHDTNWRDYVYMTPEDMRLQVQYLLSPRPVVIVSGHFGNFEVGGVISGLLGFPTFTVARDLDNPFLHQFMNRFREATGQYILPKKGSAATIDALLRSGGTLALLGDQAAGPKGCWADFFGRPASCHKAVAIFSLVNRAPMVLAYAKRLRRPLTFHVGMCGSFDPATDHIASVQQLTQWYCERLERVIRTAPDQYWWLHRRWKDYSRRKRGVRRENPRSSPLAGESSQARAT